jgi:redox-sensitive bicupin YhaK (pirin superfamily)
MITVRKAEDRGHADHGWLNSHHTFSFADYYDPEHMGFRSLRVINEDRVAPGRGFGAHSHRDMEIISYVLAGSLQHRDSMKSGGSSQGEASVLSPGEVQRMSAGSGVVHSEFNGSSREPVHFLQIWLLPEQRGIAPSYEQKAFDPAKQDGRLALIVSPKGEDGSLRIHTDARIYAGRFGAGQHTTLQLGPGRHAWVQLARGEARIGGQLLQAGDGAALTPEAAAGTTLTVEGVRDAELLVFDLP